jgi:pimeloyl-ACP methyl ester carboxylesterase
MNPTPTPTKPPSPWALILEGRAALDMSRLAVSMLLPGQFAASQHPRRVIVLPGFGADDLSTAPLRHILSKAGHSVSTWGLGRNMAGMNLSYSAAEISANWQIEMREQYKGELGVPALCDRMTQHLRESVTPDAPVTLVGWSLGGVVAREAARDLPDLVQHVITLGTPVKGGPKYTATARLFRARGMDLDWIESEIGKRDNKLIKAHITAIVSRSDAIVANAAAIDDFSPNIRHIEVDVAHIGLCFNPATIRLVLDALERGE